MIQFVVVWVLSMAGPHHGKLQRVGAYMSEGKCVETKDAGRCLSVKEPMMQAQDVRIKAMLLKPSGL
jgi:hypothetical protein